jgi:Protein of unknown function (DUF3987)
LEAEVLPRQDVLNRDDEGQHPVTTPKPNTDLSLAFLDILDKNGRHDLCAIHPDLPNGVSGKLEAATFLPDDHGDLREWIDAQQGKRNVYVSVNRARDDESVDWRLSKDDIGVIRAIYADIDPKKVSGGDASGQHFRKERERLDALAKQLSKEDGCPPSLIVDSGGGIQPWWMLRPPVPATPENVALVEGIGRTLKARFGGDSVFDVSRILRLTGTINIPDVGKLAQGRTPALATILAEESSGETYTLDQIAEWAPPTPEKAKPKDRPAAAIDMDAVGIGIPYEDLQEALRQKFEAHCASRPVVGALWRGEPAPWQGGESPSEYVFALATALRPSGAFTVTEFAQLVAVWEHRSETHADDFERYVSRAWNRNPAPLGGEGFDPVVLPAHGAEKIEWAAPADLWAARLEPIDLPAGVVPQAIECVARDQAKRLGVEAGACAAALVTAIGSLVPAGNKMQMRQIDTGWTVKPILWTALIGEPGSRKTPIWEYATKLVLAIESNWAKQYAAERRDYDRQSENKKRATKSAKAAAPETKTKTQTFVPPPSNLLEDWPDVAREPVRRRKVVQDSTTEKLAEILSENADGLLLTMDELSGLFGGIDAYRTKGGKDRPFWLQAKEGGVSIIDRKSHDTLRVENTAISVLGGIQPSKLKKISAELAEDGMLQRFTPIIVKKIGNGEDAMPDRAYADALEQIAAALVNAERSGLFKFSPEADCELHRMYAFQGAALAQPGTTPTLQQWIDKTAGEFGRLSLVFHFIEWFASPGGLAGDNLPPLISLATARRARRFLTEFVYPHALVFHQSVLGRSQHEGHTTWIAGYILAQGLSVVTLRDIYKIYAPFKQPETRAALASVMQGLEAYDWLSPCLSRQKDGRPTRWYVNTAAHVAFAERAAAERGARASVQASIREEAERRRLERPGAAEPETPRHPTAPSEGSTTALSSLA